MMLEYIIDLLSAFLYIEYMEFWFFPLLALGFLSSCPAIFKRFFVWG